MTTSRCPASEVFGPVAGGLHADGVAVGPGEADGGDHVLGGAHGDDGGRPHRDREQPRRRQRGVLLGSSGVCTEPVRRLRSSSRERVLAGRWRGQERSVMEFSWFGRWSSAVMTDRPCRGVLDGCWDDLSTGSGLPRPRRRMRCHEQARAGRALRRIAESRAWTSGGNALRVSLLSSSIGRYCLASPRVPPRPGTALRPRAAAPSRRVEPQADTECQEGAVQEPTGCRRPGRAGTVRRRAGAARPSRDVLPDRGPAAR